MNKKSENEKFHSRQKKKKMKKKITKDQNYQETYKEGHSGEENKDNIEKIKIWGDWHVWSMEHFE